MTQLDQPKLVGGQVTNGHVATTLPPKRSPELTHHPKKVMKTLRPPNGRQITLLTKAACLPEPQGR